MTVEELVTALAARGLGTTASFELAEPLDDAVWEGFHAEVDRHRLNGLLALAIAGGDLPVTPMQDQQAGERELALATHVVTIERLLLEIIDRFESAGIDYRVLKGSAYAHTAYPIPEARPFADLDLLVGADDLRRAGVILEGLGAQRPVPELRPGFDRRFGRTVTWTTHDGYEVDLHRTLASGPFTFLVEVAALFDRSGSFELVGRTVPCFDPTLGFLHSCIHLVLGGRPRLLTVRDVAAHASLPGVDLGAVVEIAARWKLTAVVARATDDARSQLALLPDWQEGLSARLRPTPEEQALLDSFPTIAGHADQQALQALRYVPGLRQKAAFAAAYAWPSTPNLRHRGLTRRRHVRSVLRRVARGRRHDSS